MSTVAVQRSKTYDIVYIAVFAVIMANIRCFYCSRCAGRKERKLIGSGIYPAWSDRNSCVC